MRHPRATVGPMSPPITAPAPSATAADHTTCPDTANTTAGRRSAARSSTFLTAFARCNDGDPVSRSTAIMSTPDPAPK